MVASVWRLPRTAGRGWAPARDTDGTALEESLDFDNGGEIATALAIVYREASNRIDSASGSEAGDKLVSAREMIAEIAEAWAEIGKVSQAA